MATRSLAFPGTAPARQTFSVVKQDGSVAEPGTVTVVHRVPDGAEELGTFDNPSHAVDFAETFVREWKTTGSPLELVDPPYGLVGAG